MSTPVAPILLLLPAIAMTPGPADGPRTPDEERASFRLADPGLVVELVAAEPDVVSPVALAWDEAGALYVAEMTDYPLGPPSGRIRRLDDPDPDTGRFRSITVFARDVPFPTGVLPHDGGLLVTAAPDVLFLRDEDGDGVADTRRAVLTGFAEGNQQLRVNAPHHGIDNRIYGANGRSGGSLRRPGDPPGHAVPIDRADFRFDPRTYEVEAIGGFSQFGLARDDWGDRFPSWNTVPVRHVVLELDLLGRGRHLAAPSGVADLLPPGDVAVFPIGPPPRTYNREPVRAFNASCGTTIYRGDALGDAYAGDVFVAEPLTQLVHRRELEPRGATYRAVRGEQGREFLAAADPWFHPVNFATGPDGCLYIADFYREWVEHPDFVPAEARGLVDWRRGAGLGRIWRVRRVDTPIPPTTRLDGATPDRLAEALGHPNGWVRDTAQRLLVARPPDEAAGPLRETAADGPTPQSRAHALWALDGLGTLDLATLRASLRDPHPRVREQALRLVAADPGRAGAMAEAIPDLAGDPDARVRFRCAPLLAPRRDVAAIDALASILDRDADDPWVATAVLAGLDGPVVPLIDALGRQGRGDWLDADDAGRLDFLRTLGTLAGIRGEADERDALIARARPGGRPVASPGRLALLAGLVEGIAQDTDRPPAEVIEGLGPELDAAATMLDDRAAPAVSRSMALRLLIRARPSALTGRLPVLLAADVEATLRRDAAEAIGLLGDPEAAADALRRWPHLTTDTRRGLLGGLVRSPRLAALLAEAIEDDLIAPAEVDADLRVAIGHLPDAATRDRLAALLGATAADRAAIVRDHVEAMARVPRGPDASRGAGLFDRLCSTCHRLRGLGQDVGPDLSGVASRPLAALVDDILDPSREVSPDFRNFVAADRSGRVLTGLLVSESPAGVTLRGPGAAEVFVPRDRLEALRTTGKSLMPEGFEAQLDPAGLADLIAYLRGSDAPAAP